MERRLLITRMMEGMTLSLERYMNLLAARQQLVASNIANADTPGYKTRDLDFQSEFRNALEAGGTPTIREVDSLPVKNDGNNVSIDREARLLAENALRFNVASNLLRGELRMVKMAIAEGKSG
ncbi:MAG TPA: flagellar basal body protein [Bryobacteraceae bacterium]|nr:flagellar basal body protein [Bryobacteraceae bacterium]